MFSERMPGGGGAQTKGPTGEVLAERTLTVMIVVTEMNAVTVMIAVLTAVSVVMMTREPHPESLTRVNQNLN